LSPVDALADALNRVLSHMENLENTWNFTYLEVMENAWNFNFNTCNFVGITVQLLFIR